MRETSPVAVTIIIFVIIIVVVSPVAVLATSENECQTVILPRVIERAPCDPPRFTSTYSMFANRLNVVVTLVFAIAFLAAESGNAQVDGFPQFMKRSSVSAPQRYCGKKLSNALQVVCDGVYNSMFKKSGQEMEMADYPFRYETYPFVPPERASGMLNRMSGGRFRRSRGIHEECCVNACTISELSSYCGP